MSVVNNNYYSDGYGMMDEENAHDLVELVARLSSPEVFELGKKYERLFNDFSVEEWVRPFDI